MNIQIKRIKRKIINEFNILDKKIDKLNTLEKIEYFYYSKNYSEKKEKKEKDNKGIKKLKYSLKKCISNLEILTIKKFNKL